LFCIGQALNTLGSHQQSSHYPCTDTLALLVIIQRILTANFTNAIDVIDGLAFCLIVLDSQESQFFTTEWAARSSAAESTSSIFVSVLDVGYLDKRDNRWVIRV
jgi:hypothetical protein